MCITRWALTPHAASRLLERRISLEELTLILQGPEEVIPQGPKYILTRTFPRRKDNKIAAVVMEKGEHGLWLVITIMVNFVAR